MRRWFRRKEREQDRRDELLSAYLDGQLDAEERARLEAQLASDPALEAELGALRWTVSLVRDLPPVPLPRNFILPQTMASRPELARGASRRRTWAAPLLTVATAVVTLLFAVVLIGDLMFLDAGRQALAPAAEPMTVAEVEQEIPPSEPREKEEVAEEEALGASDVSATEEVAMFREPSTPMPTPEMAEAAPPVTGVIEAPAPAATPMPSVSEPPVTIEAEEAGTFVTSTIGPENAHDEDDELAEPSAVAALPKSEGGATSEWMPESTEAPGGERVGPEREEHEPIREPTVLSPWRMLEIVLGLVALGLGWGTARAWHTRRR